MTPEERVLMNRLMETAEENNKMLHSIRRSMRWASVWRWIYWFVIIGSAVGAFFFLQPYLNTIMNTYSGAQDKASSLQDLINQYTQ